MIKKATASDAKGNLMSDPDTVTHTSNGTDTVTHSSNGILDETILSCGTIGKGSALPLSENLIVLTPQTLMMPAANKIFTDTMHGNAWNNWTPQQVSSVGVYRTTPGNIGRACGISETSSPDMIVIIEATSPPR